MRDLVEEADGLWTDAYFSYRHAQNHGSVRETHDALDDLLTAKWLYLYLRRQADHGD